MIPTIDFSLIGVLLAIWSVIKVIWDWVCKAFDWITQRALALLIGSKFWATAAFIASATVIIIALSRIWDICLSYISSLALSSVEHPSSSVSLLSLYVDFSDLQSLVAFILGCWSTYFAVVGTNAGLEKARRIFTLITQSWKT